MKAKVHAFKESVISDLTAWEGNPRTHSASQIGQLAASIREFGFTNPLLVDEAGRIIAGHGRLEAAKACGLTRVPSIELKGLTEDQKRALLIADNQLALTAGWDFPSLRDELNALDAANFDLALTGFDAQEIERLLTWAPEGLVEGLTDPDEVPPTPDEPISHTGDVWRLGRHRLICGDATSADDVALLLGEVQPHLMVTDPPYGVDYDANWRNEALRADGTKIGARAVGEVSNDGQSDWQQAWLLFPGEVAYVWHAGKFASTVQASLEACEFEIRCQIIWAKQQFAISRGHYHWMHEPCWYAVRAGKSGHWVGDRTQTTVWQIDKPVKSETGHSTQKPVECMRRPMQNNSSPGQAVYDPFMGSGTSIIAAEQTGRICYGLEVNPAYVDVAVTRWQAFTGKEATRAQAH